MDLFAQGLPGGHFNHSREGRRTMPGEAKPSMSQGQGEALCGINEPVGQKQDPNVGCKPGQGRVQDKVCAQRKGLNACFTK